MTKRQVSTLFNIFETGSITEGCKKSGIHRSTFYKWLEDSEFRTEYEKRLETTKKSFFEKIEILGEKAFNRIETLIDSHDERIQLQTVRIIIDSLFRLKDNEIEERLQQIEELVYEKKFKQDSKN